MRMTNAWCRGLPARIAVAAAVAVVACDSPTEGAGTFTVGGSVTGLVGVGCTLQNNVGDDLTLSANGTFTFPTRLPTGAPYLVTVAQSPAGPNQLCAVSNASGVVSGADVTDIVVNCTVIRDDCSGAFAIGAVSGDQGEDVVTISDKRDRWFLVHIREDSFSSEYVSARVELDVPAGVNYDLHVYCLSCGGALAGVSATPAGGTDQVNVRWEDFGGFDDSANILIHVRYSDGGSASPWWLRVRGNRDVQNTTCTL